MKQTKLVQNQKSMAVLATLCAVAMLAACGTPQSQAPANSASAAQSQAGAEKAPSASASQAAPEFGSFSAQNLQGEAMDQTVFTNNTLTLVNIWGTFCSPCLMEMPDLGALAQEYEGTGVGIVGIVMDVGDSAEVLETAKQLVEQTGANYPHILPSQDFMNTRVADVSVVPTSFFVDSKGNVVGEEFLGATDKATWKQRIEAARAMLEE